MQRLAPFILSAITLVVAAHLWRRLHPRSGESDQATSHPAPDWSAVDVGILGLFLASCTGAFLLKHVYGLSGDSPERLIFAGAVCYVGAAVFLASARSPGRSRILHDLHPTAHVAAVACSIMGTILLVLVVSGW
jgi:hypothetical protein